MATHSLLPAFRLLRGSPRLPEEFASSVQTGGSSKVELELIEDASARGWQREVERHHCVVKRLEQLLADLAEPLDGPEATA